MDPASVPGLDKVRVGRDGSVFVEAEGALTPLPISSSSSYDRVSIPVNGKINAFMFTFLLLKLFSV